MSLLIDQLKLLEKERLEYSIKNRRFINISKILNFFNSFSYFIFLIIFITIIIWRWHYYQFPDFGEILIIFFAAGYISLPIAITFEYLFQDKIKSFILSKFSTTEEILNQINLQRINIESQISAIKLKIIQTKEIEFKDKLIGFQKKLERKEVNVNETIEILKEFRSEFSRIKPNFHSKSFYNNLFEKIEILISKYKIETKTSKDKYSDNSFNEKSKFENKIEKNNKITLPINYKSDTKAEEEIEKSTPNLQQTDLLNNFNISIENIKPIEISKIFDENKQHTNNVTRKRVNKIDFETLNLKKHTIGKLGEEFVYNLEKKELLEKGLIDLSNSVKWLSLENDNLGYDILSFYPDGSSLLIEVKTTTGGENEPFYLTENELNKINDISNPYMIYRVFNFNIENRVGSFYKLNKSSLLKFFTLDSLPIIYKANPKYK